MGFISLLKISTAKEISYIIFFNAIWGCYSIMSNMFALIFKKPSIICVNKENGLQYNCNEQEACFNNVFYILDTSSSKSLVFEFQLICGNQQNKNIIIFIMIFGGVLGCIFNIFHSNIKTINRTKYLSFNTFIFSLGCFLSIIFDKNLYIISLSIGIQNFGSMGIHGNLISSVTEILNEEQSKFCLSIFMFSFGLSGVLTVLISYSFSGNWRSIMIYYGSISFILAILLFRILLINFTK